MSIPLNIDLQQILLHLFNFCILAAGLYILLYKPVKNFMEKRTAYYKDMDQLAEEKLSKAEGLRNAYQKQLDEADMEIAETRAQSARDAQAQADNELAAAHAQAEQILSRAQADAEAEKERIIASAREQIADLAAEATDKLMREALAAEEGEQVHEG